MAFILDTLDNPDVDTLKARRHIRHLARARPPRSYPFIASRYPFTYAVDQIRSREDIHSRAEAAGRLTALAEAALLPRTYVAEQLAEAYLLENNIERSGA